MITIPTMQKLEVIKEIGDKKFFLLIKNLFYIGGKIKETFREIKKIEVTKSKDTVCISFISKGFLRYQIRAIVGECIDYSLKRKSENSLKLKLEDYKEKNKYRKIAPSSGLYL